MVIYIEDEIINVDDLKNCRVYKNIYDSHCLELLAERGVIKTFYFKNEEDAKKRLQEIYEQIKPVKAKTYEEGFIAGFSHNIKTVEELENKNKHLKGKITSVRKEAAKLSKENEELKKRIKDAIRYTKELREKYFKECVAGSSIDLGNLLEILDGKEEE